MDALFFFFRLTPIPIGAATADSSPSACSFAKVARPDGLPYATRFRSPLSARRRGGGARWMNSSTPHHPQGRVDALRLSRIKYRRRGRGTGADGGVLQKRSSTCARCGTGRVAWRLLGVTTKPWRGAVAHTYVCRGVWLRRTAERLRQVRTEVAPKLSRTHAVPAYSFPAPARSRHGAPPIVRAPTTSNAGRQVARICRRGARFASDLSRVAPPPRRRRQE